MMADGRPCKVIAPFFVKEFLTTGAFCSLQSSRQSTITSVSRCEMAGAVQNPITNMKKILVIAALVVSAAGLKADDSHFFQASLTPDIALQPKTAEISGISLDLWEKTRSTASPLDSSTAAAVTAAASRGPLLPIILIPTPVWHGRSSTSARRNLSAGKPAWSTTPRNFTVCNGVS